MHKRAAGPYLPFRSMSYNLGMGKNKGRVGEVKGRDQVWSPQNKRWTKRKMQTGQFIDQKANKQPFRGVRKSNKSRSAK